jgi:flagellar assembly protein FliH
VTKSLSSNLFKSGFVTVKGQEKRVIDTNKLVSDKLEALSISLAQQKNQDFADGFTEGLDAYHVEQLLEEAPKEIHMGPSPEELVSEALQEIEEMRRKAKAESETLFHNAMEDGRKKGEAEGYEAGFQKGMKEFLVKEEDLKQKEQFLEHQYVQQLENMEAELVDVLSSVYETVFQVDLKQYRSIILHIITSTVQKIEGARDFLIHVSKEDFAYVSMQKKQIQEATGSTSVKVEIVEDFTLSKNDCIIETTGGIFDCGLGTQLEELHRKLKILSYEK